MTGSSRRAFFIDPQVRGQPAGNAAAMGFKAYNLARMAAIGLPVPHAFVLGTGYCRAGNAHKPEDDAELNQVITAQLRRLERATGLTYGGSRRPLLVSVRSGAAVSMPGMMDTILNVGLNETALRGLLRMTGNPRLTWDSYRRLIQSFAIVADGCASDPFDSLLQEHLAAGHVARAQELDARALSRIAREYLVLYRKLVGRNFPQDPMEQLRAAVQGVLGSWGSARARAYRRMHKIPEDAGTAVTVQRMVFGNGGGTSGSGVAFTRDPATGENRLYMDFMFNAQGEDVVSGRHAVVDAEHLAAILPTIEQQVVSAGRALETEFRDMQELEFTVQDEVLYVLQTRTGKRTSLAHLAIACDLVREGVVEPAEALARVGGLDLQKLAWEAVVENGSELLATATSAGAGVAIGAIAFDSAQAQAMAERAPVILVRREAATDDLAGVAVAQGLLTAAGGRTSHAAVVAREMNKVALVCCSALVIDAAARRCRLGTAELGQGDVICLDGNTGRVYRGQPELVLQRPDDAIAEVERWRGLVVRSAGSTRSRARAG